jgi:type II secretory ATPase GspE/PulE/Tfp pilus assembly ATPase PilB-like protein
MVDYYTDTYPTRCARTVEDPVEVRLKRASQQAVNEPDPNKLAQRFAAMIREILRSDPDLVMVQECRDAESATASIEGAITGRVLVSTVHTTTPAKIIRRLLGWGIDPSRLSDPSEIIGLIGVRLVKRLCSCKLHIPSVLEAGNGHQALWQSVNRLQQHANLAFPARGDSPPTIAVCYTRNPNGCPRCHDPDARIKRPPGTQGRTQIAEIIRTDADLLDHLVSGRFREAEQYLRTTLRIASLYDEAIERVRRGELCPLDAESVLGHFPTPRRDNNEPALAVV